MSRLLTDQDIKFLQSIFVGANLLAPEKVTGVWDIDTRNAYEGWCVNHGVLTIAAKTQPHSLAGLPLPLQKYLKDAPEVETPAVQPVAEPTPAPTPVVEPVAETVEPVVESAPELEVQKEVEAETAAPTGAQNNNANNHFRKNR